MFDLITVALALLRLPPYFAAYLQVRYRFFWHNRKSKASDPGLIRMSPAGLKLLCPEYFSSGFDPLTWLDQVAGERAIRIFVVADQLIHGDSRAAVVMSTSPLLVAAYTDELDCVAMLKFPDEFVDLFGLRVRGRLMTVNRYHYGNALAKDLEEGVLSYRRYKNFQPYIANFLTGDVDRVRRRQAKIGEDEWKRTWVLGDRYLSKFGHAARDGSPARCAVPAEI